MALDLKLLQEAALRVGKAAVVKRTVISCSRVISSSSALSAYIRTALAHEAREQFRVLFLDHSSAFCKIACDVRFRRVSHRPLTTEVV